MELHSTYEDTWFVMLLGESIVGGWPLMRGKQQKEWLTYKVRDMKEET